MSNSVAHSIDTRLNGRLHRRSPQRILHVIPTLKVGGAEMMLARLLPSLDRRQFTTGVVALDDGGSLGDELIKQGITVYTLGKPLGAFPTPADIHRLAGFCRAFQPDIVHGWLYRANIAAHLAALFVDLRLPVIWSIHYAIESLAAERWRTRAVVLAGTPLSRLASGIVFVSERSLRQHRLFGYDLRRGIVIPNGFDTMTFEPDLVAPAALRAELGLDSSHRLIGMMARYHPVKNHRGFLEAAAMLTATDPRVHFVLAGGNVTTDNPDISRLVTELGLTGRVHLLGLRHDMPRLLAGLDLLTTASTTEAFPLVVGEAMACGTACVVTDVGDSAELVGETGLIVPPADPAALAHAWQCLLAEEPTALARRGRAARARIIERYSLPVVVDRYAALYEAIRPGSSALPAHR